MMLILDPNARDRYFTYDDTVYRVLAGTMKFEAWIDGSWRVVVPSEQDYDHLLPISPEQADQLTAD